METKHSKTIRLVKKIKHYISRLNEFTTSLEMEINNPQITQFVESVVPTKQQITEPVVPTKSTKQQVTKPVVSTKSTKQQVTEPVVPTKQQFMQLTLVPIIKTKQQINEQKDDENLYKIENIFNFMFPNGTIDEKNEFMLQYSESIFKTVDTFKRQPHKCFEGTHSQVFPFNHFNIQNKHVTIFCVGPNFMDFVNKFKSVYKTFSDSLIYSIISAFYWYHDGISTLNSFLIYKLSDNIINQIYAMFKYKNYMYSCFIHNSESINCVIMVSGFIPKPTTLDVIPSVILNDIRKIIF